MYDLSLIDLWIINLATLSKSYRKLITQFISQPIAGYSDDWYSVASLLDYHMSGLDKVLLQAACVKPLNPNTGESNHQFEMCLNTLMTVFTAWKNI